jgi:hypothetical protein
VVSVSLGAGGSLFVCKKIVEHPLDVLQPLFDLQAL